MAKAGVVGPLLAQRVFLMSLLYVQKIDKSRGFQKFFCAYNYGMNDTKRGRPPKEPGEALDERLYVRLTSEEKQLLESAAEASDKKLSAWIREKLVSTAKRALSGK